MQITNSDQSAQQYPNMVITIGGITITLEPDAILYKQFLKQLGLLNPVLQPRRAIRDKLMEVKASSICGNTHFSYVLNEVYNFYLIIIEILTDINGICIFFLNNKNFYLAFFVCLNLKNERVSQNKSLGTFLTFVLNNVDGYTSWSAATNDANQWIQARSLNPVKIHGVIIQGRNTCDQWVKKYKLSYSRNGSDFQSLFNDKQFNGSTDRNSDAPNMFDQPIVARAIRIHPTEWNGHISLRFEVLIE